MGNKYLRVIDLETLFETPAPGGICEVGFTDVVSTSVDLFDMPTDWVVGKTWSSLINPKRPIPPETSAIHHIIDEDVVNSPEWNAVTPFIFDDPDIVAFVAHGAKFERAWIGTELTGDRPWIDTYRCALGLYPDAPSFSNNSLRYYLRPEGLDRSMALPSHRAGPDSYVTAFHVRDMLNAGNSFDDLVLRTDRPAMLPVCKIGDDYRNGGKGTPWKDVSWSMLEWILKKDFDEDTIYTVRQEMQRRQIDQRIEREKNELERQLEQNGMGVSKSAELPL